MEQIQSSFSNFGVRRSIGACEKFHGAVIEHVGHENTRVFKEPAALGEELSRLNEVLGSETKAEVGVLFDGIIIGHWNIRADQQLI